RQVALAIDNAVNFESARAAEDTLTCRLEQLRLLLDVTNSVTSHLDLPELFRAVSHSLRQVVHQDFAALGLYDETGEELRAYLLDKGDDIHHVEEGSLVPLEGTPLGLAIKTRRAVVVGRDGLRKFPSEFVRRAFEQGLRSGCSAPLLHNNRLIGVM